MGTTESLVCVAAAAAAADLATKYFIISNAITAFYIIQKLLFLNSLHKETTLSQAIKANLNKSIIYTWYFAIAYAFIIILICCLEAWLRCIAGQGGSVVLATFLAGVGRLLIVALSALVSAGLLKLIGKSAAQV